MPSTLAKPSSAETMAVVERFNDAFNAHDVNAVMDLMTEQCVFENTSPAPDGAQYRGRAAVRKAWEDLFRASPHATFSIEETFAHDDRAVVRWTYRWIDASGRRGHVRGVDIFRVEGSKVAEKLSYVKG